MMKGIWKKEDEENGSESPHFPVVNLPVSSSSFFHFSALYFSVQISASPA
jgi:hypothetical protein